MTNNISGVALNPAADKIVASAMSISNSGSYTVVFTVDAATGSPLT